MIVNQQVKELTKQRAIPTNFIAAGEATNPMSQTQMFQLPMQKLIKKVQELQDEIDDVKQQNVGVKKSLANMQNQLFHFKIENIQESGKVNSNSGMIPSSRFPSAQSISQNNDMMDVFQNQRLHANSNNSANQRDINGNHEFSNDLSGLQQRQSTQYSPDPQNLNTIMNIESG